MQLTKRTHSNPCAWTAYWNTDYYKCALSDRKLPSAREQKIYSLNVKADKIIPQSVENIHYDKLIGISEISPETIQDFCKKYFPEKYAQSVALTTKYPVPAYLDAERLWSILENHFGYQTLFDVMKKQRIDSKEEKYELACFIVVQRLRSHAVLHSMIELAQRIGTPKFEFYLQLQNLLSDSNALLAAVAPLVFSQWIVYVTNEHTFPLPDTPIFTRQKSTMVALSPTMLLEINHREPSSDKTWLHKEGVSTSKLNEYRKRCISNTFKEIIFGRKDLLEDWRRSPEFKQRAKLMATQNKFNILVKKAGMQELWKINAFGNSSFPRR